MLKPSGEVVHRGLMTKKGDGMMSKWQQRWFVLYSSGQLQYFEAEDEKNLKGTIVLDGVKAASIVRLKPNGSDYSFAINTPKRKWVLNPGTGSFYDEWQKKLLEVVGS